jgi:predicted PurR-regulated permease PerM
MHVNSTNHFFYGLLLAVVVLAILMFLPFLTPIVLAGALAIIFSKVHSYIRRIFFKDIERSSLSAIVTLLLIILSVFVPAFLVMGKIYTEVQTVYVFLIDESNRSQVIILLNDAVHRISQTLFGLYPEYSFNSLNITSVLTKMLEWIFTNLDTVFTGVSKVAMGTFIMLLALFYFLRDGRELRRQVIMLSPLGDTDDERIMKKIEQAVYSIFAGSIIVALIQGILTGIGFAIFHVPNPALWGSLAAIAALIPGIGTALVIVPGIIYLLITGATGYAIGLIVWGVIAVSLIDNVLGPILVNRGIEIHPFLILLSVLGGLIFFGPIGFVLGPIVLAFLFALLEIYRISIRRA